VLIRRVALIRQAVLRQQPEGPRLRAGGWPPARRRRPLLGPARRTWPGGTEARRRPAGRPVRRQAPRQTALRPDEEARIQQVQREPLTQQEMQVLRAVLLQP